MIGSASSRLNLGEARAEKSESPSKIDYLKGCSSNSSFSHFVNA